MKNKYVIEILYDNGIKESFPIGERTEEQIEESIRLVSEAFEDGLNAVIQIPNESGLCTLINASKVSRINHIKINE